MSSISGVGASPSQFANLLKRPEAKDIAGEFFNQLDKSGKGYLEKADFQSAFGKAGGASPSTGQTNQLFAQLDSNKDGKVSKDEFSESLKASVETFELQLHSQRLAGNGNAAIPEGAQLLAVTDEFVGEVGGSPAAANSASGAGKGSEADHLSQLLKTFEAADRNKDGQVSLSELLAYQRSKSESSSTGAEGNKAADNGAKDLSASILRQIQQLLQAYGDAAAEGSSKGNSVSQFA